MDVQTAVTAPWVILVLLSLLLLALRYAALLELLVGQSSREAQFLTEQVSDWRDQFSGSIDEFLQRDAA